VSIHGVLRTGDSYDFSVSMDPNDSPIGHQTPNGWWVKGQMPDGKFMLARGPRLHVFEQRIVSADELGTVLVYCSSFLLLCEATESRLDVSTMWTDRWNEGNMGWLVNEVVHKGHEVLWNMAGKVGKEVFGADWSAEKFPRVLVPLCGDSLRCV
jgi:hypothetical protein